MILSCQPRVSQHLASRIGMQNAAQSLWCYQRWSDPCFCGRCVNCFRECVRERVRRRIEAPVRGDKIPDGGPPVGERRSDRDDLYIQLDGAAEKERERLENALSLCSPHVVRMCIDLQQ